MVIHMREESVRKRTWVKNVIIIFLIVMLVLMFFSNTIMNRALPEVAAQNTTSGTITARIRGSGTVAAIESYELTTSQTRTVNEVRVRLGDEVSTGDVLLVMEGTGSEELDAARGKLHDLEIQLERKLIDTQLDGDFARENREIQNLRDRLTDAQNALAALPGQGALDAAQAAVDAALSTVAAIQTDMDTAQGAVGAAQTAVFDALDALEHLDENDPEFPQVQAQLDRANAALETAQAALNTAQTALVNAEVVRDEAINHRNSIAMVIDGRPMLEQAVRDAQRAVADAVFDLSQRQREGQITTSNIAIDIRELNRQIDELREEVEDLESGGTGSELTSPVNGVVTAISISPGNQTQPETPLMVIVVVDRGYTLSFPVSTENSTRVRVGDIAEVDRGWWGWGDETTAILTAIRNNPQDPVTSRLLEFTIHGDVEVGTQLNLTLNQRSENYETIVPNSAVRTDANGDFVLVVMSRSGPLGNRFIATRTDVRVLATDDTHTAVSGAFSGWGGDFVITHSDEPITPGMQVRLVDNP